MDECPPPFALRRPPGEGPEARREGGRLGQDLFWVALAGSVAGFALLVFLPNRDRLREAAAERELLRTEIASLEVDTARRRRWARALADGDPEAWAAVARRRLGWLGPGEVVVGPRPGASARDGLARAGAAERRRPD